jgi:hypothetical protein
VRRAVATAVLLLCAACGAAAPEATVHPSGGRSLLPPSAGPGSPEPSPSDGASGSSTGGGADTGANGNPAASAPGAGTAAAPTKAPTPKPTKKPSEPAITGEVVAGGQPVTGAHVTISGDGYHHNTTTSSQGKFRSATPPGTYTVTATSPSVSGCSPRTVTVEANAASHVTITCTAR